MANDILVVAEHAGGAITESSFELLGKAADLAAAGGGSVTTVLIGAGDQAAAMAGELGRSNTVITVDGDGLGDYTAEAWERVLADQINQHSPRLVLMGTSTQALDQAAALSALCSAPLASYVVDVDLDGDAVVATSQIYGGKMMAEVELGGPTAICASVAGSFPADAGRGGDGATVQAGACPDLGGMRTGFIALNEPDAGDVDITAAEVLVAVGRGIGGEDDMDMVQELADALDAPVAASRPVTDAGWLPKSRQVGKSGQKVKPRAYLMFGISGAPEHLEGMRDAELIVACNTDEKAPIFDVAHYGTTVDLFDLLPELTEQLEG